MFFWTAVSSSAQMRASLVDAPGQFLPFTCMLQGTPPPPPKTCVVLGAFWFQSLTSGLKVMLIKLLFPPPYPGRGILAYPPFS